MSKELHHYSQGTTDILAGVDNKQLNITAFDSNCLQTGLKGVSQRS